MLIGPYLSAVIKLRLAIIPDSPETIPRLSPLPVTPSLTNSGNAFTEYPSPITRTIKKVTFSEEKSLLIIFLETSSSAKQTTVAITKITPQDP
jgi:hypothetical protein